MRLELVPAQKAVVVADGKTIYLNVEVIDVSEPKEVQRLPLNTVFVLDKSGSMNADDKWGYVREAVQKAIAQMGVNDYFTLVTYDTQVTTLIPPTRNIEQEWALNKLNSVAPGGSTALYAGLNKGVENLREHLSDGYVNRVILLSDGLANVGPQSPGELRAYAEKVSGDGVQISTMGVGADYNEDLMMGVALESGGAYYFIDEPEKIVSIFEEELSGLKAVTAREIVVKIVLPRGVKYVGSMDRGDEIETHQTDEGEQVLLLELPDLYDDQKRQALLELKVPDETDAEKLALAGVTVTFKEATEEGTSHEVAATAEVEVVEDAAAAEATADSDVMLRVVQLKSAENRARAMALYDQGREAEAKEIMQSNSAFIRANTSADYFAGSEYQQMLSREETITEEEERAYEAGDATARKAQQWNLYEATKK